MCSRKKLLLLHEERPENADRSHHDGDVRDIKYRPYAEIDEVDDVCEANPIRHVAECSCRKGDAAVVNECAAARETRIEKEEYEEEQRGGEQKEPLLTLKDPERSPRVQHVGQMEV